MLLVELFLKEYEVAGLSVFLALGLVVSVIVGLLVLGAILL